MPTALTNLPLILSLLVLATSASMLSTDLYAPSLPHLPAYFGTSVQAVKLTMSLNVLAFGVAQLFYGPLSDRIGRRPVLIAGMAGFTVFSFACAAAQSIEQLIGARIALGFCAAAEAVIGYAVVYDLFDEQRRIKALAVYGMAIAAVPATAPILGGYIHIAFGWQANFQLVTAIGLITTILIWSLLPESSAPDQNAFKLTQLLRQYRTLLSQRTFVAYGLILSAALGSIFAFITVGPFIIIELYGVATEHYGYYNGLLVLAFLIGSYASSKFAGRVDSRSLLGWGLLVTAIGIASTTVCFLLGRLTLTLLITGLFVFWLGLGPIFAVAPALAMRSIKTKLGAASALLGALQMGVAGLAALAVSLSSSNSAAPLLLISGLLLILAVVSYWYADESHSK